MQSQTRQVEQRANGPVRSEATPCLRHTGVVLVKPSAQRTPRRLPPLSSTNDTRLRNLRGIQAPNLRSAYFVTSDTPLLLIDVDGVLSLFGFEHAAPPP